MDLNNKSFENGMNKATQRILENLKINVANACKLIVRDAKKECPVDEGLLRARTSFEVKEEDDTIRGIVGTNVDYAPYVHNGTGIYAKNGKGRKTPWRWKGESKKWKGWHYTKGQKPQPYLENAKLKNMKEIARIIGG